MKLWDKGKGTAERVHAFTVGNDRIMDKRLASADIRGTIAHVTMLSEQGLFPKEELAKLIGALEELLQLVVLDDFQLPNNVEDIHSYVEMELTKKLGDLGKKVHSARSRNDQVLVDLHLYLKETLIEIRKGVVELATQFCMRAEELKSIALPGYTHTQVAMPSSFGMWLGAYAECLADDLILIDAAIKWADQNPLGTAAGYGSSFPINRERTTELLGFSQLKVNPVAAQLNRGKLEQTTAFALSSLATTLGKFATDCVLYLCQNFDFIAFPDEVTTGSSLMPHKKNPDVFELIRAKSNQVNSVVVEINALTRNLTSGYHRDFQLLKEPLFRAIDTTVDCLGMTQYMLPQLMPKSDLLNDPKYGVVYSVEAVARLVQEGMSFRDAYVKIGQDIENGMKLNELKATTVHTGSLDVLGLDVILGKLK